MYSHSPICKSCSLHFSCLISSPTLYCIHYILSIQLEPLLRMKEYVYGDIKLIGLHENINFVWQHTQIYSIHQGFDRYPTPNK